MKALQNMRSILIAFAMFSRFPVPQQEWTPKNMRYAMAAFPLVGLAVGLAAAAWLHLADALAIGPFLRGTGFALVPFLFTGGIHLDGFCDTVDALASHGDVEKKRRILKDPHVGPFAAFTASAYLLAFAALASEADASGGGAAGLGALFVLSRSVSGLGVVAGPIQEGSSLGKIFHDNAAKKTSALVLLGFFLAAAATLCRFGGLPGALAVAGCLATAAATRWKAMREFGGLSGDIFGWFLQLAEIAGLFFLVLGGKVLA